MLVEVQGSTCLSIKVITQIVSTEMSIFIYYFISVHRNKVLVINTVQFSKFSNLNLLVLVFLLAEKCVLGARLFPCKIILWQPISPDGRQISYALPPNQFK